MLSQKFPILCPYPTPLRTHSQFMALAFPCTRAYKVRSTKGPLFPVMADQAIFCYIYSQRHDLLGYCYIVVLPIGLQTLLLSNNYFSLISLNINGLNSPIKTHRLTDWLHKRHNILLLTGNPSQGKRQTLPQNERLENNFPSKWSK